MFYFFFSSRRRHTRCALVTGVQTCALPIWMGENIWGRPNSPVNKRSYGPGQHGQRRKSKVSDFGIQLRAKQKLKGYYGDVTEKQFKRTYQEAGKMKGDTGQNLIGLLERRLDMVVYRQVCADGFLRAPSRQPWPHLCERRERSEEHTS